MTNKKLSVILVAVITCVLCASLITGATFALFTDNDKVNITVSTGKVDVESTIDKTSVATSVNGVTANNAVKAVVSEDNKGLTITDMLPGDVVTFRIVIANSSTVDVKYRVSMGCKEANSVLFDNLLMGVKVVNDDVNDYAYCTSNVSSWDDLAKTGATLEVRLELPVTVTEAVANQTCNLSFAVEAVQANANLSVVTYTPDTIQAKLDATKGNETIYLADGNYGTLYLGVTDFSNGMVTAWAGGGAHAYKRTIENLTIVGSKDAVVDNVVIESGLYREPEAPTLKTAHKMPEAVNGISYLNAHMEIKNLTFRNVTFSGIKTAMELKSKTAIDGLTFDGCTMVCEPSVASKDNPIRLLYWAGTLNSYFEQVKEGANYVDTDKLILQECRKNISVVNCTIENAYMAMETRGTENITIVGNTFKNMVRNSLLLTADPKGGLIDRYHGSVIVAYNKSIGNGERFLRLTGMAADCSLLVMNNAVTDYVGGKDDDGNWENDFIKVTGDVQIKLVSSFGNTCVATDTSREMYENIADIVK